MSEVEQVLIDIERLRKETPFGEVSFSLQQHSGQTVGLVVNNARTEKYPDNIKALSAIVGAIKDAIEREASGDISLSIKIHHGKVDRIMWQSYDHLKYELKKNRG